MSSHTDRKVLWGGQTSGFYIRPAYSVPNSNTATATKGTQPHSFLLEAFTYIPTKSIPLWKSSPRALRGWTFPELLSGGVSCGSQSDLIHICAKALSLCSWLNMTNLLPQLFVPSVPLCSLWVGMSFLGHKYWECSLWYSMDNFCSKVV